MSNVIIFSGPMKYECRNDDEVESADSYFGSESGNNNIISKFISNTTSGVY